MDKEVAQNDQLLLKSVDFKIAQKVTRYLGYFYNKICLKYLSKLAQSR